LLWICPIKIVKKHMQYLYHLFISLYGFLIRIVAVFNIKARNREIGSKQWERQLQKMDISKHSFVWIHCASAGEFEQAIPIIQLLKQKFPNYSIAVSFFSPSGYELYRKSTLGDVFFYFPLDTIKNARKVIQLLQPKKVLFIRNEIWWNILLELRKQQIPVFLLNRSLSNKNAFFYRIYLKKTLPLFTKIFYTQEYGNTKIERVIENKNERFQDNTLADFCRQNFVLIAGSSWDTELQYIFEFYKKHSTRFPSLKIIIAPHEFDENLLRKICKKYSVSENEIQLYSGYDLSNKASILLLDKKGILKYVYRYADVAFIGGGFDKTVHNISEAIVYGIPTLFGPKYSQFEEVEDFIKNGIAFPISNYNEFEKNVLSILLHPKIKEEVKIKSELFFSHWQSASDKIIDEIMK